MDKKEIEEILNTYKWIKVKKYEMNPHQTWEERYKDLEKHHLEETQFLIDKIREIVIQVSNSNKG